MANNVYLRPSYCTVDEYETITGGNASSESVTLPKLQLASDIVDFHINVAFKVDTDGNPTNSDVHDILRDATAHQMAYMVELGVDDFDKIELHGKISLGSLNIEKAPDDLAPRAKRILVNHGFFGYRTAIFYNYDDSLPKAITDDQVYE